MALNLDNSIHLGSTNKPQGICLCQCIFCFDASDGQRETVIDTLERIAPTVAFPDGQYQPTCMLGQMSGKLHEVTDEVHGLFS